MITKFIIHELNRNPDDFSGGDSSNWVYDIYTTTLTTEGYRLKYLLERQNEVFWERQKTKSIPGLEKSNFSLRSKLENVNVDRF